jgi:putative ABC transport system permease protein
VYLHCSHAIKRFYQTGDHSIVIATPLAWLVMHKWLQGFAYRQNIQWWVFAAAGVGALFIAFITISFQSIKAALVNPAESLRSE